MKGMRLERVATYSIVKGPWLKGNGPHEVSFRPAQIQYDAKEKRWEGVTSSGMGFHLEMLDEKSKPAWETLVLWATELENSGVAKRLAFTQGFRAGRQDPTVLEEEAWQAFAERHKI